MKTIQNKVEKATLGDLGALAQIKQKLQQDEKSGGMGEESNDEVKDEPKDEATERAERRLVLFFS